MTIVDWLMVVLYFVLLVVIGVQAIRKVQSSDDFAVAGRRIIWPVMFATLGASLLGGGSSLGTAGQVFTNGYVYMFAGFALCLQTLLVGYFVAPRLNTYEGAQTVGDVMAYHYGRVTRLLTGVFSIGLCAGVLGGQILAVGTVFNAV